MDRAEGAVATQEVNNTKKDILPTAFKYPSAAEYAELVYAENKRQGIEVYREALLYQKEKIAELEESLINTIIEDPEIPLHELIQTIRAHEPRIGMSEHQFKILTAAVTMYVDRHQKVNELVKHYKDPRMLFRALFGQLPKGRVFIDPGPMTLYFRCFDPADYALIQDVILRQQGLSPEQLEEKRQEYEYTSAVYVAPNKISEIWRGQLRGLEGSILVENSTLLPDQQSSTMNRIHEEQHALDALIVFARKRYQVSLVNEGKSIPRFLDQKKITLENYQKVQEAKTTEEKIDRLKTVLRKKRRKREDELAYEILACFNEGLLQGDVLMRLNQHKKRGRMYDFWPEDYRNKEIERWKKRLGEEDTSMILICVGDVFVRELQPLIEKGIQAVAALTKAGFSVRRASLLLMNEPFDKWKQFSEQIVWYKNRLNSQAA